MRTFRSAFRRRFAISALLALVILRAWVPQGFMPSASGAFQLELCKADLQASLPTQDHHPRDGAAHHEGAACPFGHASVAGPLGEDWNFVASYRSVSEVVAETLSRPSTSPFRTHQARGPPPLV
jgi:hypothetical protein